MALVVEDGTGLSTAESYISVADAETRLDNLGDSTFSGSTTGEKEQALRKATNFMLQKYRNRWKGKRAFSTQALDWPRVDVIVDQWVTVDSDEVPTDIANACADLALLSLTETLNPVLDRTVVREKVGPIETEYAASSREAKRWTAVDDILKVYLTGGGRTVLVRG